METAACEMEHPLAHVSGFDDPVVLDPELEPDLVATDRVGHVDLHRLVGELSLVPGVTVVVKDELLVE